MREMGGRIALLRVDEMRELGWVAQEDCILVLVQFAKR